MTGRQHDELRAAAALLAIAACDWHDGQAVLLGADPDTDRRAGIACLLAYWVVGVIREAGLDPRAFARDTIADSLAAEATEGTP